MYPEYLFMKLRKAIDKAKKDKQEIMKEASALKLKYFKGSANKCPKCKKKGNFGSIVRYECESGNRYLLCGWCGAITKCQKK